MMPIEAWLENYLQTSKELLLKLREEPEVYSDEKLALIENTMEQRQALLDELSQWKIEEAARDGYSPLLDQIKSVELEIETAIKAMMSVLDLEREIVQDQRRELNRLKKANRSYAGTTRSAEGYFIDKKK